MSKGKQKYAVVILIIICCAVMAAVETLIEPAYAVKSAVKAAMFLMLPLIFMKAVKIKTFGGSLSFDLKGVLRLFALGGAIYLLIMAGYALTRNIFDYSVLVESLSKDQNVDGGSFIWVALYISFCNSFLEEFLFRQIAFIRLAELSSKRTAYIFSSLMFAVYHVAMIGQSFPLPLLLAALVGLAVGGFVFDLVDEKSGNLCNSWFIHMFADFALMTVWYIHI